MLEDLLITVSSCHPWVSSGLRVGVGCHSNLRANDWAGHSINILALYDDIKQYCGQFSETELVQLETRGRVYANYKELLNLELSLVFWNTISRLVYAPRENKSNLFILKECTFDNKFY